MTEPSLNGKTALITGAGRGIGRAIALALAKKGIDSALSARNETELEATQQMVAENGGRAVVLPADLTEEKNCIALVERAIEHLGHLDMLINNAGIGLFGPLEEMTTEQWDSIMHVNVRAPFILCREAIPHLKKQPLSWIISVASVVAVKGYVNQSAYSASKHALLGMHKAMAKEVAEYNTRVHVICPGGVETEMVTRARPDLDTSVLMKPEDIANTVAFLLMQQGNAVIDEIHLRRASSTPWA